MMYRSSNKMVMQIWSKNAVLFPILNSIRIILPYHICGNIYHFSPYFADCFFLFLSAPLPVSLFIYSRPFIMHITLTPVLLSHIKILFYIIAFLLHIRIIILLLQRYVVCFSPFFHLDYVSFWDIFLPISVSPPFNFPLVCLSIVYAYNLYFVILQSHHFILSLLFLKFFPFSTTITDEGLSPKCRIFKFFPKFTYFALGSLISRIIVSLYVTSATQNTSTSF